MRSKPSAGAAHGPRDETASRPTVAVFLDGLGADAIARMPFLASQPTVHRMRTELGYSITCHASMYTGLRPDRHGLWFLWQRMPERSPFRWLRPFRFLDAVDNLPLRVLVTKATRQFVRTTSWFGLPYPVHVPWRYLPELDIAERRLWSEPGYLTPAATVFDSMRDAGIGFEIVGMARERSTGLAAVESWRPPEDPPRMTYLFIGDIDRVSHEHGQGSAEATELLGRIDRVIEHRFRAFQRAGSSPALVVWSDHGHHDVRRLNPLELLQERRLDIAKFPHVIDTNFIRLWIDDDRSRRGAIDRLNDLGIGHVLTDEELQQNRVRMPDDRYGNVVFYLELPYAFSHTIWGFGRRLASGHGYLPTHPGSDAVFVSNLPTREGPFHLVDVAPSLLELVAVPIPPGLDGRTVWESRPKPSAGRRRS